MMITVVGRLDECYRKLRQELMNRGEELPHNLMVQARPALERIIQGFYLVDDGLDHSISLELTFEFPIKFHLTID